MIIKNADDKQCQIEALQTLLAHPGADSSTKRRIEREILNIKAGIRGEEEAAYEIKVHWGESKNWVVIHDLRIEHGGLVAQIDHLLINRFMEVWVCESKHFSEGIAINEHGEFSTFRGSKPYGVSSPIEQNNKHLLILKRFFDSGGIALPTRMGLTIKPTLKSLVLISNGARISRPKARIDGIESIIKIDQLFKTIDKAIDDNNNPLNIAKLIGQETLKDLGEKIAQCHKPIQFDWAAKFGLSSSWQPPLAALASSLETLKAVKTTMGGPEKPPQAEAKAGSTDEAKKPKQKLVCHSCGVSITYNVAKFCWVNKKRFAGNIYCMECQKKA
ncbi:MAG: NERD domain-containing protein [Desulfurivibrio sp.]|nr:MAG: NERD domain-containing protein [Desulfurivibrio sp.]